MGIPDKTKLEACKAVADLGKYVTVFTDDPGTDGDHEGDDVERAETDWSDDDDKVVGDEVNVKVGEGTYKHAGVYSKEDGGDFIGSAEFEDDDVKVSGSGGSIDVTIEWT